MVDRRAYCGEPLPWVEESWTPPTSPLDTFQGLSKGFYDEVHAVMTRDAQPTIRHDEVRRQIAIMEEARRQNRLPAMKRRFLKKRAR